MKCVAYLLIALRNATWAIVQVPVIIVSGVFVFLAIILPNPFDWADERLGIKTFMCGRCGLFYSARNERSECKYCTGCLKSIERDKQA